MVTAPSLNQGSAGATERTQGSQRRNKAFHRTKMASASADASDVGRVKVDLVIASSPDDIAILQEALATAAPRVRGTASKAAAGLLAKAFENVAERYLQNAFKVEFDNMVEAYRLMLHEALPNGEDRRLKAALNRARLQERILASTPMADQAEACELLGLSDTNPSATMKRKEAKHELLRFTVDGRAAYPLFQFDVEGRRIYSGVARIIANKPESWSDFRLLHWLTRPHLDFEGAPAEAFATEADAIIAAFEREIEPEMHG